MLCDGYPYFGVYQKCNTIYCVLKNETPQYIEKIPMKPIFHPEKLDSQPPIIRRKSPVIGEIQRINIKHI